MPNSKKDPTLTGHPHCIIPILGPTGSGKSHFVNQLLGRTVAKVGHSFSSYTSDILPVEVPPNTIEQYLPGWDDHARHKLIIVDTPGFDDTNVLEAEVLKRLSGWLARSYGRNAKLAGAIYLHDINACHSMVLGTTKWSEVLDEDLPTAEGREQLLREGFWKDMIDKGSKVERVDTEPLSAWKLIEVVLTARPPLILVLGVTGTGKSSLILSAEPGEEKPLVNSGSSSSQAPVQAFKVGRGTQTVLLVDTPGFNNTDKSDKEVLTEIVSWLKSREKGVEVAGVIYLLDISNRAYAPLTVEKLKGSLPVAQVEVQCHEQAHHIGSIGKGETVWNAVNEVLAHETRVPAQAVALECILNNGTNGKGAKRVN
ncbi:hypothetical protein D9619_000441 [Psilocybe cf. subviscida]|uniref:G domain-containing protein n=1 Tax=Psilocybe cf. subviscida TaxID=2480587 RepID=A0A8H5BFV7_9AGAR|nr:hypothetical protein D9619_000441 [Psilocybe cf. subviscida]